MNSAFASVSVASARSVPASASPSPANAAVPTRSVADERRPRGVRSRPPAEDDGGERDEHEHDHDLDEHDRRELGRDQARSARAASRPAA